MKRAMVALVVAVTACSPSSAGPPSTSPEDLVAVADQVCPLLWNWQLDVGKAVNVMSTGARNEPDPAARRRLVIAALDTTRALDATLRADARNLDPGPYVDRLRRDIVDGSATADTILDEIQSDLTRPEIGDAPYETMVSHVFILFEKVIDVAKPEMSTYGDPALSAAFASVPQCQNGVKDVDDGVPRAVPSS